MVKSHEASEVRGRETSVEKGWEGEGEEQARRKWETE